MADEFITALDIGVDIMIRVLRSEIDDVELYVERKHTPYALCDIGVSYCVITGCVRGVDSIGVNDWGDVQYVSVNRDILRYFESKWLSSGAQGNI